MLLPLLTGRPSHTHTRVLAILPATIVKQLVHSYLPISGAASLNCGPTCVTPGVVTLIMSLQ